jgi:hypothetical protein
MTVTKIIRDKSPWRQLGRFAFTLGNSFSDRGRLKLENMLVVRFTIITPPGTPRLHLFLAMMVEAWKLTLHIPLFLPYFNFYTISLK